MECCSLVFSLRDRFIELRKLNNTWCDAFFNTPESERIAFLSLMIDREKIMYCSVVQARLADLTKGNRAKHSHELPELESDGKRIHVEWNRHLEQFIAQAEKCKVFECLAHLLLQITHYYSLLFAGRHKQHERT